MWIMLGDRRKVSIEDESVLERLNRIIRHSMYSVFQEIIYGNTISVSIFHCLSLIEFFQIVYYSILPSLTYLWTSSFTSTLQDAIMYFQINSTLQNLRSAVFLSVLYCVIAVQILATLLLIYSLQFSWKKFSDQKQRLHGQPASQDQLKSNSSGIWTFAIRFLSFYGILLNSILTIPITNVFASALICSSSSSNSNLLTLDCAENLYSLHVSLAAFGFLFYLLLLFLFQKLYIDLDPLSSHPFAKPQSKTNYLKTSLKILLPFYSVADSSGDYSKVFIIGICICHLVILSSRYVSNPYFNRQVQRVACAIDCCLLWISLSSVVCGIIDDGSIGLLYMFLCAPFTVIVFSNFADRKRDILLSKKPKRIQLPSDLATYVYFLIDLVRHRQTPSDRIRLEGILKQHASTCKKPFDSCNCSQLILEKDKEGGGDSSDEYVSNINESNSSDAQKFASKKWFVFIQSILDDAISKYPKKIELKLLHAHLLKGGLDNKYKALLVLMQAEMCHPNSQEEVSIFACKNAIESEIKEGDVHILESTGIPINSIIEFHTRFAVFEVYIERCVNLHLAFWKMLVEVKLNVSKLISQGSMIADCISFVQDSFDGLQEINSNHFASLSMFGYYLREILCSEEEADRIIDKAKLVQQNMTTSKSHLDLEKIKYADNTDALIMMISGNLDSIGIVTNSNNEIYRMLGYERNEVIDQNVNKLMPEIYGGIHDTIVRGFLETSQSKIIGFERTIMCKNKRGYIVPSTLMAKVLPTLYEGIQMVGFLKEIGTVELKPSADISSSVHYIVYREDNLQIQGVSECCFDDFGVPATLTQGDKYDFTIDQIIPAMGCADTLDELRSPSGFVVELDTREIRSQFMVDFEEVLAPAGESMSKQGNRFEYQEQQEEGGDGSALDSSSEENKVFNARFRRAKMRAHLIEEHILPNKTQVNILKLVEIIEHDVFSNHMQITNQMLINRKENPKSFKRFSIHIKAKQQDLDEDPELEIPSESDDLIKLKDLKSQISDKSKPKSIKLLSRVMLSLIVFLLSLSAFSLISQIINKAEAMEGMEAISTGYLASSQLFETNYKARLLNMLGNYKLGINPQNENPTSNPNEDLGSQYRAELENHLTQFQENTFTFIRYKVRMESRRNGDTSDPIITLKERNFSGSVIEKQKPLADSIFVYLTQSSTLKSTNVYNFVDRGNNTASNAGYLDTIAKNIYYVRQNGLFVFREQILEKADDFYKFYLSELIDRLIFYRCILFISLGLIVIAQLIIIPIIFRVINTNNQVLSLFLYIPNIEIQRLILKCEKFINRFIGKSKQNKNSLDESQHTLSEIPKREYQSNQNRRQVIHDDEYQHTRKTEQKLISIMDETTHQLDQEFETKFGETPRPAGLQIISLSQLAISLKVQSPIAEKDRKISTIFSGHELSQRKQLKPSAETAEDLEQIDSKIEQLLTSKDKNNRKTVMFRFGFMSCLCGLVYVLKYLHELNFTDSTSSIFHHMRAIQVRPSFVKYLMLFTLENILDINSGEVLDSSNKLSVRSQFSEWSYENDQNIIETYTSSFPSQLDAYMQLFSATQTKNVCAAISTIQDVSACEENSNGILKSGLQTALVSFYLRLETFLIEFKRRYSEFLQDPSNFSGTIQSNQQKYRELFRKFFSDSSTGKEFTSIQDQIVLFQQAFDSINELLNTGSIEFVHAEIRIEIIEFCGFTLLVSLGFWFVWLPYLNSLSMQIWRTKGLLHMIPIDTISKYESIQKAFISSDIISAVN